MIKINQTILHDPENKISGNCFTACVASILECNIDSVPYFTEELFQLPVGERASEFEKRILKWFHKKGYSYIEIPVNFEVLPSWTEYMQKRETYHIIVGESPRFSGGYHACVGKYGEIIFDPHPSHKGLNGPTNEMPWLFGIIAHRF